MEHSWIRKTTTLAGLMLTVGLLAGGCLLTRLLCPMIVANLEPQAAFDMIQQNADNPDFVILDIRTSGEFNAGHVENSVNIPADESFETAIEELDKSKTYLVFCASCEFTNVNVCVMLDHGFSHLSTVIGGFAAWVNEGLPAVFSVVNLTVPEANALIQANTSNPDFTILDVRTPGEFATEHIAGAVNCDYRDPNFQTTIGAYDRDKMYLVYCGVGGRSAGACGVMNGLDFVTVYNMLGGITEWKNQGLPTVQ